MAVANSVAVGSGVDSSVGVASAPPLGAGVTSDDVAVAPGRAGIDPSRTRCQSSSSASGTLLSGMRARSGAVPRKRLHQ